MKVNKKKKLVYIAKDIRSKLKLKLGYFLSFIEGGGLAWSYCLSLHTETIVYEDIYIQKCN